MTKRNLITRTAEFAVAVTETYIRDGDFVVDATCGNGKDTVALALAAGESGAVLALDIQEDAVRRTLERVKEMTLRNIDVRRDSFVHMKQYFHGKRPQAVVFNLGYLPGGNKRVTTRAEETMEAVRLALESILPGGIVTIVLYSGHPEGAEEKAALLEMAKGLDRRVFHAVYTDMLNQPNNPPEVLWITKKKEDQE